MDILMEVITVNLVVMLFDQVFIGLTVGSTEAKIGTQGSNPCPSEEYSRAIALPAGMKTSVRAERSETD
jgi:hypothetical protein